MSSDSTISFWADWMRLQIRHNLDQIVADSIKDFHFPGLNYVCFQFTPHQTIRLYIVRPEDHLHTNQVSIHNHLYDSQLLCLHGWLRNTVYRLNNTRDEYNLYHLTSALHPDNVDRKIRLDFLTCRGLDVVDRKILLPGDHHFQAHTEIHGVDNDPNCLTAWMVFEFPTVKQHSTLFSKEDLGITIPTPNAYNRYTHSGVRDLVMDLLGHIA